MTPRLINLLNLSEDDKHCLTILLRQLTNNVEYVFGGRSYSIEVSSQVATRDVAHLQPVEHGQREQDELMTPPVQAEHSFFSWRTLLLIQESVWPYLMGLQRAIYPQEQSTRALQRKPEPAVMIETKATIMVSLSHTLLRQDEGSSVIFYAINEKPFSAGSFGKVYQCVLEMIIDKKQESDVVINAVSKIAKCIQGSDDSAFHASVQREYKHLKQVESKTHLVKDNHHYHTNSMFSGTVRQIRYWLITEEIIGCTLDKIDIRTISLANKFKITLSLIDKLQQLHTYHGVGDVHIHNDIKPSNIIIDTHFIAHYIDFGMATTLNEPVPGGTIAYLGPEHYDFARLAAFENDIHALGIVLFQLFLEVGSPFCALPKGQYKSLSKHFHLDAEQIEFTPVKVYKNKADKMMHFFNVKDESVTQDAAISGLTNKDSETFFRLIKKMRDKNPKKRMGLDALYDAFLDIAKHVDGFDMTTIRSDHVASLTQ